ncbi:ParA family protein [Ferrovum myxofaciens]|jgi:chromosome partitioning protein|uniref:Sporulation initiation inhibitor protein Soj n=3 Tax=root TaxID=1 RepID=A0A149VZT0_9PROT|nr:AAA family ATPase [Ferrovum myxofaciens]KXW58730.1 sporulation initiation inhibitor protein Soj [Ferrovum myxofaciens]MBU6994945.1 ParA family protein [Ferrovum myxofaciens]QKE41316.1 MAG: ParA family protein [Ferrovum myxofaciens]
MGKILAVTNQKGGVGKTTTVVNLAASLTVLGQKVLLVDLDPQGNATTGSGLDKNLLKNTVYQVLTQEQSIDSAIHRSPTAGYDVLPANRALAGAEIELVDVENREFRLKNSLANVSSNYDIVLIDCPPALNLLTLNGLTATWRLIIPMQCEYYALEGLTDLLQTIRRVRSHLNPGIAIEGLLRTMLDPRSALAQQVSAQLERHFAGKIYRTAIPRNVRLAEAPSHGKPAIHYDPASKGAIAYLELAKEIMERFDGSVSRETTSLR